MEKGKGLRTAREWLHCDPQSFLRRWPIILVEDAVPSQAFPGLIWLMAAVSSCDYIMTGQDEAFVMETVAEAFSHDKMIEIDKVDPIPYPDLRPLICSTRVFDQALWIRIAYGGMGGDQTMVAGLALKGFMPLSFNPVDVAFAEKELCKPLEAGDILDVSRDFHVFPSILDGLAGSAGYEPDEVKTAIWDHGSGVTFRESLDGSVLKRQAKLAKRQKTSRPIWEALVSKGLYP